MNIDREDLEFLLKQTFYSGMNYGYGVDHEHKSEEEAIAWQEFRNTVKQLN